MKQRKLPEYLKFNISVKEREWNGKNYWSVSFQREGGEERPSDYKLTPAQWKKASQYITRNLRPFIGYDYQPKEEYKKNAVYKIR